MQPGRSCLGTPPTTDTAGPHADAYLWIKRVGESDGSCGRGEPGAGTFVSQYAINLARNGNGRRHHDRTCPTRSVGDKGRVALAGIALVFLAAYTIQVLVQPTGFATGRGTRH